MRRVGFLGLVLMTAIVLASCGGDDDSAPTIRVAVAANFAEPLRDLAAAYQEISAIPVSISVGSTGSLHGQIEQGAPFDLFFAADAHRPELLDTSGKAVPGSRRTYARGRLVIWSPGLESGDGWEQLGALRSGKIAMANPDTAPYGAAAKQVLIQQGLWETVSPRVIFGQSIGQAHQFVDSGAAPIGLVAFSQVVGDGDKVRGSVTPVAPELHDAIDQQVVMVNERPEVRAFWRWVTENPLARERIREFGYETPALNQP